MLTDVDEILARAMTELKVGCDETLAFARGKQRQRAEPWQQTVIDILEKALNEYDRIMKENSV